MTGSSWILVLTLQVSLASQAQKIRIEKSDKKKKTDNLAETYTSTGVRPPWVTEQQIAPARANLEYNATPLSFSGALARTFCTTSSTLTAPVDGAAVAILI